MTSTSVLELCYNKVYKKLLNVYVLHIDKPIFFFGINGEYIRM